MERWKQIDGYDYEVSDQGNVRSMRTGKILKPCKNKDGYLQVCLSKNGEGKKSYIHRLVAETWIPNPNNLPQVNHINENKEDNSVDNLEWVSHKNNACHGTRGERIAKALGKKVYCYELNQIFDSINEASRQTGIFAQNIGRCCRGELKMAGKMHWKYVDES